MIDSNLNYNKEFEEIKNLFENAENINVIHRFTQNELTYINTVTVLGETFLFKNKKPNILNELEEKRYIKRYAKLSIYKALSQKLKQNIEWGSLTGVRPTKLAYQEILKNGSFEDMFVLELLVSKHKTQLVKSIIDNQAKLFNYNQVFAKKRTDLFISLPFCPTRCEYCSFVSSDIKCTGKYLDSYINALIKEIESAKPYLNNLQSIYIGGGTPVCIGTNYLERVLKAVSGYNVELTVEAGRPDVINSENIKLMQDYGVTRICINPQTFNQKTLNLMQRKHTVEDIYKVYELAKGKFIINMDLICGLTGEDYNDFCFSLDSAIKLNPENITVHTLCLKKGSSLKEQVKRLPSGEVAKMVNYAHMRLNESGYMPYYLYRQKYMADNLENTGYAKPNTECVYNVDIMEEVSSIIACGANAVSKKISAVSAQDKIVRYGNPKDIATYIAKIDTIIKEKGEMFGNI